MGTCKLRRIFFTPSPIIKAAMLTPGPAREEAEPQANPASGMGEPLSHRSRPSPGCAGLCEGPEGAACPEDPDALGGGPLFLCTTIQGAGLNRP